MLHKLVELLVEEYGFVDVRDAVSKAGIAATSDVALKVDIEARAIEDMNLYIARIKVARVKVFGGESGSLRKAKDWVDANFPDRGKGPLPE